MQVSSSAVNNLYEFGSFRLDPQKRILLHNGEPVALTPKCFETLLILVQSSGRPLRREDLMKMVWPDSFVEEGNLTQNISVLRKTFGAGNRYIVTIPGYGYQFAENVREVPAEERGSAEAPPASGMPQQAAADTPSKPRRAIPKPLVALAILILVAAAGLLLHRGEGTSGGMGEKLALPAMAAAPARRSVAVLGFSNASGRAEDQWISTAFSEMLNTELAAGNQLRLVSGEDVARAKLESSLPDTASLSKDSLRHLHAELGTDLVVIGSYTALHGNGGERIRFDVRLQDTSTGETLVENSATGTTEDLFQLVGQVGAGLRQELGIEGLSDEQSAQVRAGVAAKPEATRLYAEGLDKLRRFDALGARDLLEKAVAADPGHALFHSALAESWAELGWKLKAGEEAKRAFELSRGASLRDQLVVEGRYREFNHDLPAAIKVYSRLWNLFPDDLEYGLRLAEAQTNNTQGKDALASVERMRGLPEPQKDDPRIDLAEATAAESLSDFARELQASSEAAKKASMQGSQLLVARALREQGYAAMRLGRSDEALSALEQARKLWASTGDEFEVAAALHMMALTEYYRGNFEAASQSFQNALSVFRRIGAEDGIASCSHNYAMLLHDDGKLPQSRQALEEALRIQRELHDERGVASDLDDLGNVFLSMGDLTAAERVKEQAAAAFHRLGNGFGEAITLGNLGEVLFAKGELAEANQKFQQSLALKQKIGYKRGLGFCWMDLATVLRAQDRLEEARALTQQALNLRQQMHDEFAAAESELQLAQIELDQGHAPAAEPLARTAAGVFVKHKAADSSAIAYAILSRILLAQGKAKEARAASQQAMTLGQQGGDREGQFQALLAAAAVLSASGREEQSIRLLETLHSASSRYGFFAYQLESSLRLGQLDFKAGRQDGRRRLASVEAQAERKGYLLLARQARATLKGKPSFS